MAVPTSRVLVVDDEKSILMLLEEALTQWGYQVTAAGTGADALAALRTQVFDAALTDVRMPDMSGLDLLRELKKRDESIEVVIMTGYPTISSAVEALKEGAYDYLSKPLILDELRHLMSRMMERKFLRGEVHTLRARLGEELTVNELIGSSNPMQKVKDIIVEELGVERDKLTNDASFMEDLGADSLDTVELVMAFEKEFDIDIPDEEAEKLRTVGAALQYLHEKMGKGK